MRLRNVKDANNILIKKINFVKWILLAYIIIGGKIYEQ